MIELTPEIASQILDRLGPPQHLEPRQALPTPELLRLLRSRLSSRTYWVAKAADVPEQTVRRVLRSLLADRPSKPESLD